MRKLVVLLGVIILFSFTENIFAQQWSAEQLEVWKTVESYWSLLEKNDADGFLSNFDESYLGWNYSSDFPGDYTKLNKINRYYFNIINTLLITISPAKIWIEGDFAFVHYYYTLITKDLENNVTQESGRWTDILMKKGNKWLVIGDHGGKTSK